MDIVLKLVNSRGRVVWHAYKDGDRYRVEHDHGGASYNKLDNSFYHDAKSYKDTYAKSAKPEGKYTMVCMFNYFCEHGNLDIL